MNNLEYICTQHKWIVGAIIEDLFSAEPSMNIDESLEYIEFPEHAMRDLDSIGEWLEGERVPGAWEPHDCRNAIEEDMTFLANVRNASLYLEKRGIGYDKHATNDDVGALAALDMAFRWQRLYGSTVGGAIFESNYRKRPKIENQGGEDGHC